MFDSKLDRSYLAKVYGLASVGLATAAYGANLNLNGVVQAGFLLTLAQLGLLLGIAWTEASARQTHKDGASPLRYAMFIAFALCAGVNVGSWINLSLHQAFGPHYRVSINDNLVYEAFVLSSLLFGVFTAAGIIAPPGVVFVATVVAGVGGMITFWSSIGALFGLVSLMAMEAIVIRLGLVIVSAYVLIDTWRIVEQTRAGVRDVVTHSITLLTDFLQMFVRVLHILAKSKREKNK